MQVKSFCLTCFTEFTFFVKTHLMDVCFFYSDSKLLSGFLWHVNGNPGNTSESPCILREYNS
jgi:hypothetical protein